jgi:hypothetical protein
VHQHPLPGKVNYVVKQLDVKRHMHVGPVDRVNPVALDVVREATVVVALPKETEKYLSASKSTVARAIRLAKHRSTPVRVILPDGKELMQ